MRAPIQLSRKYSQEWSKGLDLCHPCGSPRRSCSFLACLPKSGLPLAVLATWEVNQWTENLYCPLTLSLSLSFSLCNSGSQTNESLKDKKKIRKSLDKWNYMFTSVQKRLRSLHSFSKGIFSMNFVKTLQRRHRPEGRGPAWGNPGSQAQSGTVQTASHSLSSGSSSSPPSPYCPARC